MSDEDKGVVQADPVALDRKWTPDDVRDLVAQITSLQSLEDENSITQRLRVRDVRGRTLLHEAADREASYNDGLQPLLSFIMNKVSQPGKIYWCM